ncbi:hypothetical protein ACXR0O_25205 [Verrucomicrobiota bacterium sgz303538]
MKTGAGLVRLDGEAHAKTVREHSLIGRNVVLGNPDVAASSASRETQDTEPNATELTDTELEMALIQLAVASGWRRMDEKPAASAGNVVTKDPEQLG